MSDALIASLQSRISELTDQLATVKTEAKTRRKAQAATRTELEAALAQVKELATDRDAWKGKAEAAPGEKDKKIAELEGQILERQHADVFGELKQDKELGLDPRMPVTTIMRELGYKPEGAPDRDKLKSLVAEAKPRLGHLFSPAADSGNAHATGQAREPGPGAQRGGSPNSASSPAGTVSRAQLRDAKWMFANQALAATAVKEGRIVD
jgi:hypothetical protein